MPSVNLDIEYFEHRKTKRLVGLLGRGAEVLPVKLWCYCGKFHADTGRLTDYSPREIESFIGWWGKEGDAIAALEKSGFIDPIKNGWVIHGWKEHSGHLAVFKKRAKLGAKARWDKYRSDASSNASSNALSNALPNPTQPTQPDQLTLPISGGVGGNGQQASAGVGSGGSGPAPTNGGGGNLTLSLRRVVDKAAEAEANRIIEVTALLQRLKVNPAVISELSQRHDVTVRVIESHVRDISRDKDVVDVAAILVHRLKARRQK